MESQKSKKTLIVIVGIVILAHIVFWGLAAWLYFKFVPSIRERASTRSETTAAELREDAGRTVSTFPTAEPESAGDFRGQPASSPTETALSPASTETADSGDQADAVDEPLESRVYITAGDLSENQKKVIAYVEKVRGLTTDEPLRIVFMTRDELQAEIVESFESQLSDEDIADERGMLSLFGFIPEDFDIKDFYTRLYTEQIAGYYNNQENIMMLPQEADESEILRTLSHEYTHFLQFSNFPELKKYYDGDYCRANNESCLLGRAVIEGDAVLTETIVGQDRDMMRLMRPGREEKSQEDSFFSQAPLFYQESILMDYSYGFTFVYNYFMRDGFDGVNKLLLDPPASAEQLIHPEKYGIDEPISVSIDIFDEVFEADGCELVQLNVMNELDLRWMMTLGIEKRWRLDVKTALRATEGWGGGAFRFGRCSGEGFLFSETQWDSRRNANEFFDAMEDYLNARFGKSDAASGWVSAGRRVRLESSDNSVFFMIVPEDFDLDEIETLIGEIGYSEDVAL